MNVENFNEFPDLPSTHVLDNRIYTNQEFFELEQKDIFQSSWLFVCHESELPKPGCFRTTLAAGKPIVIVRGDDGKIRSFYNICRHRSSPVVRADTGRAKEFQCFYHLWTYNLQGNCTGVTKPDGYKSVKLDKTKLGLLPTNKIDELIKPFAKKELNDLSKFLRQLKSNKSLDQLLNLKDKEL